ncbi:MAG: 1,4-dihydroxy-2-naphthoyl-CoA synthase [Chloroflexi bacterium]|nr:1,4-dihydroxy-2-naphthoyl-CoA synthase [Chloroflexota bacterium]
MPPKFTDILFEKKDHIARITINRPEALNAFRTHTLLELIQAFEDIDKDESIGVAVLTGAGSKAFCVGGDAKENAGKAGYSRELLLATARVHELIRKVPQPVIAAVNGYAIGGGHVMQLVCDLSLAAENAKFGQAGPRVGSFDAGFGTAYMARVIGDKKAREIWYLCRQYTAQEALQMGLVNKVVPADKLEAEVNDWCQEVLAKSPTALKFLKASFNADSDGIAGLENMSWPALWMYYQTEEAMEGRAAFLEKRPANFNKFRK